MAVLCTTPEVAWQCRLSLAVAFPTANLQVPLPLSEAFHHPHSHGRPHWHALLQSQALQTVLLFCLAVLALSGTPIADALEAALASPTGAPSTPSFTLASQLQLVFGIVVPVVAVVWTYAGGRILAVLGACGRRGATRGPRTVTCQ